MSNYYHSNDDDDEYEGINNNKNDNTTDDYDKIIITPTTIITAKVAVPMTTAASTEAPQAEDNDNAVHHYYSLLHEAERNAYKVRIEFLEETIRSYRSLPADLLGSFDVSLCSGNCDVLRQNFWDVWNTNTSLNAKFEHEMRGFRNAIRGRDDRIMELESVNALLEKSLSQSNEQLFASLREAVEKKKLEEEENNNNNIKSEDLEAFFTRRLEEERSTAAVLRFRIAELEESLYLKEQESGARQMQINYLLSLQNQLEHASEVNMMRNKLREAERRIQELMMQRFAAMDSLTASFSLAASASGASSSLRPSPRMMLIRVNIEQDQRLASRFRDFFRRLEVDAPIGVENHEEHMYEQFLLDQPNQEQHKLRPEMYLREGLVRAMHAVVVVGGNSSSSSSGSNSNSSRSKRPTASKRLLTSSNIRRDFAACLASMGGRFKRRRGVRYWVNVGMTRKPLFSWDVV